MDRIFLVKDRSQFEGSTVVINTRVKSSSDLRHFVFKINIGRERMRHKTTLKLNDEFLDRTGKLTQILESRFKFRVVVCRIQLFPTLISNIK